MSQLDKLSPRDIIIEDIDLLGHVAVEDLENRISMGGWYEWYFASQGKGLVFYNIENDRRARGIRYTQAGCGNDPSERVELATQLLAVIGIRKLNNLHQPRAEGQVCKIGDSHALAIVRFRFKRPE